MSETQPQSGSPDSATARTETYAGALAELDELYADCNGHCAPTYSSRCASDAAPSQSPSTLIADSVVAAHSEYNTWTALAAAAPHDLADRATLETLPCGQLDEFLTTETEFQSGTALFEAAAGAMLNQTSTVEEA